VFERYNIVDDEDLRQAVLAIEAGQAVMKEVQEGEEEQAEEGQTG